MFKKGDYELAISYFKRCINYFENNDISDNTAGVLLVVNSELSLQELRADDLNIPGLNINNVCHDNIENILRLK